MQTPLRTYLLASLVAVASYGQDISSPRSTLQESFPPIFSPQAIRRFTDAHISHRSPSLISDTEIALANARAAREILQVDPVPPQFDSRNDAFKYTAEHFLPYSGLLAISAQKAIGNMNGGEDKPYGAALSLRGFGAALKGRYAFSTLRGLSIEGMVTTKKDVQLMVPLSQFKLPYFPSNAQMRGGLFYDVRNHDRNISGKPSIGIFGRW